MAGTMFRLGEYVRRQPNDVAAYLEWVELVIGSLQTAEERAELCRTLLKRPELAKSVSSDLHRRLAEFHRNRGENNQAMTEAQAALGDYDFNLAARMMLDWLGETAKGTAIESAVAAVIKEGKVRTYDMGGSATTLEMAEAIARKF